MFKSFYRYIKHIIYENIQYLSLVTYLEKISNQIFFANKYLVPYVNCRQYDYLQAPKINLMYREFNLYLAFSLLPYNL